MTPFTPGTTIQLNNGTSVTVVRCVGAGGQGQVYQVRYSGHQSPSMALKWYTAPEMCADYSYYDAMLRRCHLKAPSPAFLWPLATTKRRSDGAFGYIMPLCPPSFYELGDFFCIDRNPEAWFSSNTARLNAAITVADSFMRLHKNGLCAQDINDGNFFVEPTTGKVLICDNDNIVANGHGHGIVGKPRYTAPEVMTGGQPDIFSDRFAIAVILYRIFMIDHPLEGLQTISSINNCLNVDCEKKIYGSEALFCHDPKDASNRPTPEFQPNSLRFWPELPSILRRTFEEAFSLRALKNPTERTSLSRWLEVLMDVRRKLVTCRADTHEPLHDFLADENLPDLCPMCGKKLAQVPVLEFDSGKQYRIPYGKQFFINEDLNVSGECKTMNMRGRGVTLGLINTSGHSWTVLDDSYGYEVEDGSSVFITDGTKINFGTQIATIRY